MPPDALFTSWITGMVGKAPFFDDVMSLIASDYFVTTSLSLILLGLWFGARSPAQREQNQWAVMGAAFALGIACLIVWMLNHVARLDPWPRPFVTYESARQATELLFYKPTDPSFPSNPAAISFATATGIWLRNHKASLPLFVLAILWSFARVYVGVHYPSDIIGGALIGVFAGYICFKILLWLKPLIILIFKVARRLYLA